MKTKFKSVFNQYRKLPMPVKASLWFTICNVLNKGIALLSTPIFTRLLSTEEYGEFTVFQSWYSILVIFATFNLFIGSYEKSLVEFEEDKERFTTSLLGLTSCITLICGCIYFVNPKFWQSFLGLNSVLMVAMFIELLTMPAYEFWATKQRFAYKYKALVACSIFISVGSILFGVLAVLNTSFKAEARVYSDVAVKAIIGGGIFVILMLKGKQLFHWKYWKYALIFNIPLIPHFLSTMILNQSDRIMIKNLVDSSSAAVYGVAYTIGTMVLLITTAINNSFTPYIYQSIKEKKYEGIKKNGNILVILVFFLAVISMIFAPEIIYLFAGKKYYEAIGVIPPVAASVFLIFIYNLFSNIEYYYKKTKYIAIASIICAVANVILNYIFIPVFGYYAAGYTTLVCYLLYAITHFCFCRKILKKEKIEVQRVFHIRLYIFLTIVVIGVMIFMSLTYDFVFVRYTILFFGIVAAIVKRKQIIEILQKRKRK